MKTPNIHQIDYEHGVQQRSALGQSARAVVFHRYLRSNRYWEQYGSLDHNFSSATLVFQNGHTLTKCTTSSGDKAPFGHSEMRAIGLSLNQAVMNNRLTLPQWDNTAKGLQEILQHLEALSTLDKIVVYSERSPCDNYCKTFFEKSTIPFEIGYDTDYQRGRSLSLDRLEAAKKPLQEHLKHFYQLWKERANASVIDDYFAFDETTSEGNTVLSIEQQRLYPLIR